MTTASCFRPLRVWKASLAGITAVAVLTIRLYADWMTGGAYILVGAPTSGGGTSSGGAYLLNGWVASAGAGVSQGEDFELTCGLTGIYTAAEENVTLRVAITPDGQARLWWPAEVYGYALESSAVIGPAAQWLPVSPESTDNSHVIAPTDLARFFRLRKL